MTKEQMRVFALSYPGFGFIYLIVIIIVIIHPSLLVIPPPDIKIAVDKLAEYISRHGTEMYSKIALEKHTNPKFSFLLPWGRYFEYYDEMVRQYTAQRERERRKEEERKEEEWQTWLQQQPTGWEQGLTTIHNMITSSHFRLLFIFIIMFFLHSLRSCEVQSQVWARERENRRHSVDIW